jgi:cytochrome P450
MLEILWIAIKLLIYFCLAFASYLGYNILLRPWLYKTKYRKYANMYISDTAVPVLGDFIDFMNDMKAGRAYYDHLRRRSEKMWKHDLRLQFYGNVPMIKIISAEAMRQFENFIPSKIDRQIEDLGLGKSTLTAFSQIKTTKSQLERKKNFMSLLSLNSCSKYIPFFLKSIQWACENWKEGDTINWIKAMNSLTFSSFSKVLFGDDMHYITTQEVTYIDRNHQPAKMEFQDFLIKHFKDLTDIWVHPLTIIFPYLNVHNLCQPFKRIDKNNTTMRNLVKEVMKKSKDVNSIYHQIKQIPGSNEHTILEDIIAFIVGGTETSSHAITSTLYYLKKNPMVLEKLMNELEKYGFWEKESYQKYTLDNIHEMNYLSYVIKEVQRYDNPAPRTLIYAAQENIEIWGIPIYKNERMTLDINVVQFNPDEWQKPLEFLPERFDPESEYFYKPGPDKRPRSPYSYIPFSIGGRKCPGQSFALLEIKVAVIYILTHFKFEVPQETLDNPGAGFAISTHLTLDLKITDAKGD